MAMMMNKGHADLSRWGFSKNSSASFDMVLDIGCGGGANLSVLLKMNPKDKVIGVDYSALLKPGGIGSITEEFADPDYPRRSTTIQWEKAADIELVRSYRN